MRNYSLGWVVIRISVLPYTVGNIKVGQEISLGLEMLIFYNYVGGLFLSHRRNNNRQHHTSTRRGKPPAQTSAFLLGEITSQQSSHLSCGVVLGHSNDP